MRKFLLFVAILLALAIAGVAAIVLFPPAAFVQAKVLGAIESATGGKATAGGSPKLSLIPRPALEIQDLSLTGATKVGSLRDASAKRLAVEAELWPLFRGRAVINSLAIEKPVISLADARMGAEPQPADGTPATSGTSALPFEVRKLEVTDGKVVAGAGSEQPREFSDIRILAESPSAAGPLTSSFAFTLEKEKVEGTGTISSPEALFGSGSTRAVASAASKQGKADFEGELSVNPAFAVTGTTKIEAPSLRSAAQWLGANLPGNGFGEFSLGGKLQASGKSIALSEANVVLDGNAATGTLELDTAGPRPSLKANLVADALDARPYLGTGGSQGALESVAASPEAAEAPDAPLAEIELVPLKDALEQYIDAPQDDDGAEALGPVPAGDQLEAMRHEAPIDLSALKAADVDVKIAAGSLALGWGNFGPATVATRINDGALEVDLQEFSAEGGSLTGKLTVDARPSVPVVGAVVKMTDIESEAIVTRLAGKGVISGKASGEADVKSQGTTTRQILDQLAGKLSVKVVKGTVIGYDVRSMLLNWLRKHVYSKTARTPFDGLDASFAIDKGVARTSGIELTGPSIAIKAKGAARLSTRQIDYRSRLSVTPPPKDYGIPVRITGLWTGPKVRPDVWSWITGSSGLESVAPVAVPELKDPELDALLKRALEKAGPARSLDPAAVTPLQVISGELKLEDN